MTFEILQRALVAELGFRQAKLQVDAVIGAVSERGSHARRAVVDMMGEYFGGHAAEVDV